MVKANLKEGREKNVAAEVKQDADQKVPSED